MTRIEYSIAIEAPVEHVFHYAADYRKWHEWFEGVSNFNPTTEITQGNGARYAYKATLMGVSVSVETEVHNYVINRGWTGVATKGMPHRTEWIFEQVDKGTKFTYALEYSLPIPLLSSWIDSIFMKPLWTKIITSSLNNLKQQLLAQAGNASQ